MDTALVNMIYTILVGGTATSALTELLKLPFIPIAAQKYPRITAAVLSTIAAVVSLLMQGLSFGSDWKILAANTAGSFLISALVYNQALRGLKTNTPETDTPKE